MSKADQAIREMHMLDRMQAKKTVLTALHPAGKLLITILYIGVVMSFPGYNLSGLLGMGIVLIILMSLGELPFHLMMRQLKILLLLLLFIGIANPILDREILTYWGSLPVTGGMISFATLYLKGIFSLMASYILIASTGMEKICYGLQTLHVPSILITVILLIYRYILLFLKEVRNVSLAYSMRAPSQKGIQFRAWGSLAGSMLLRSVARSEMVYESMTLRGFCGTFRMREEQGRPVLDWVFVLGISVIILVLRTVPVFELAGSMFL